MERAAKRLQYDFRSCFASSAKEKMVMIVVVASGSPLVICRLRRFYLPMKTEVAGGKMDPF